MKRTAIFILSIIMIAASVNFCAFADNTDSFGVTEEQAKLLTVTGVANSEDLRRKPPGIQHKCAGTYKGAAHRTGCQRD